MKDLIKSNYNQITLKAEKEMVNRIREIAAREERSIQTVTNRILRRGLKIYEQEKEKYIK